MPIYIPHQGDIVAFTFDPQSGHEQKGRRPAFVVSKKLFNSTTGMTIVCPITNTDREFPFHVPMSKSSKLTGFIMVEQVKSVDFRSRRIKRIEHSNEKLLAEVLSILDACKYILGSGHARPLKFKSFYSKNRCFLPLYLCFCHQKQHYSYC
ncbi:MAG: hypothetical protein B6I31_04665 [Desulfobacteraceae bacterium 4572_19]|nr:MAG: hypothetical protein B6I31_04665 [Desulfobacteraceae bacterium 4572_19]